MTKLVSVVIPCYNEEKNVSLLAQEIESVFNALPDYDYECVFVDDASNDGTRQELQDLAARNPKLRSVRMQNNGGQSRAIVVGFWHTNGDLVLTIDGDLQNDPHDFPKVLELLEAYDCVFGYRAKRQDTWLRKVSGKTANKVRNAFLHDGVRDTGCGIKGFHRQCLENVIPFNGLHRFFGVFMRQAGFSIGEVAVAHRPRVHGVSKYGVSNRLWRGIYDLFGVAWLRKRMILPRQNATE